MPSSSTHGSPPGGPSRALSSLSGGCFWFPLGPGGCLASGWWRYICQGNCFQVDRELPVLFGSSCCCKKSKWIPTLLWWLSEPLCGSSSGCAPTTPYLRIVGILGTALYPRWSQTPDMFWVLQATVKHLAGVPLTLKQSAENKMLSHNTQFYHPSYSCKSITESCTGPVLETCTAIWHISHT